MMAMRCLYCYKELTERDMARPAGDSGFHASCSKKMFGQVVPPVFDFTDDSLTELAMQMVTVPRTVTGVQPKLSLDIEKVGSGVEGSRFTVMGVSGDYILKPPTKMYRNLPELEDVTMHLATISKIATVPHSLIKLKDGKLAYITKRVDRAMGKVKLHMEDMCQLTERLTEHKYKGSYGQIAKKISEYSVNPGLDLVNFYEQVIFSFLTGNNDMHLKNFSLLKGQAGYTLCPAYDMVASELVVEGDPEELALNLNGKKRKLKRKDFETAMEKAGIEQKQAMNIFNKFRKVVPRWYEMIAISFLPDDMKEQYQQLIRKKLEVLGLGS